MLRRGARLAQAILVALVGSPRLTLVCGCLLALFGLGLASQLLSFSVDRTQLLDPQDKAQRDWNRYIGEFGRQLDYIVLLRAGEEEDARQATEALAQLLEKSPHFHHVFYKLDLPEAARHGLYFLSRKQLVQLAHWLTGARPWLALLARHPDPGGVMSVLSQVRNIPRLARALQPVLPLATRLLSGLTSSLESGGRTPFVSPLGSFQADVPQLAGRTLEPGQSVFYYQLADGRTFVLVALPRDASGNFAAEVEALDEIQSLVSQIRRSYRDVQVLVSGEPVINTTEVSGVRDDAIHCAIAALVVVSVFLVLAFGQLVRPLCAVLGLLIGLSWSVGFAAVAVGRLNLITGQFVAILIGLGITFSIQMLCHYKTARAMGCSAYEAVVDSLPEARHQSVAAITTAIAFLTLQFTSFRAAAELGLITGVGVLLCYLATLTMVPSLLVLAERRQPAQSDPRALHATLWLEPVERWLRRHPRWIGFLSVSLTAWCLGVVGRIPFDYNLLRMQPAGSEAIRVEAVLQRIDYSQLYAVSLAADAAAARTLVDRLSRLPTVSRIVSVVAIEPGELRAKQPLVKQLVDLAPRLKVPREPLVLDAFEMLTAYQGYLKFKDRLVAATHRLDQDPDAQALRDALARFDGALDLNNPGPIASGMESYQRAFFKDLAEHIEFLRFQKADPPDMLALVPESLRIRTIAKSGVVCLRIFPNEDCWERERLADFIRDLRTVDPDITGIPVLLYTYLEELRQAYTDSGRNALVAIVLVLLVYYRSFVYAGLSLLPKLTGVLWTLGAMLALGTGFNAVNFLALPLTLGIGLVFGIEALRVCRTPGRPLMSCQSAGSAVVLSGLTTMLGFSTLMLAHHRGVASFGLVMTLGVGMNLLTSLLMLPAFMGLPESKKSTPH